ncbi:MAG: DUF5106 domain-containing protein [Alistipes sp.]|jgi:hypothetical protein|nr:DUF5106 domain-containing protein [Alistipes sp.]
MKITLILAAALLMAVSCGGQRKNASGAGSDGALTADSVTIYRPPQPPAMMTDPAAQLQWATEHYFDDFQFADTTAVPRWGDYAEQAFVDVNYALAQSNVPFEVASATFTNLFRKAAVNKAAFMKFAEVAEKYLFDPNYPMRNEELYIVVLRAVLDNQGLDEWERVRPREQLRLALKNRVGDLATDFRYTLDSGASGTLSGIGAPYTLIFFNNPGCPACRQTIDRIMASPFLSGMIEKGNLAVLALYTDADLDAWREYNPQMPQHWILAYDAGEKIKNEELYDIKAIPTMYLLDAGKRVVLKDEMSVPRIEQTLAAATTAQ